VSFACRARSNGNRRLTAVCNFRLFDTDLLAIALVFLFGLFPAVSPCSAGTPPATSSDSAERPDLEALRRSGDIRGQRQYMWDVIVRLTQTPVGSTEPTFESWYGEDMTFGDGDAKRSLRGIYGFSRGDIAASTVVKSGQPLQTAGAPVLTYTLYNYAAYSHIRRNKLNRISELKRLEENGAADGTVVGDRSVPSFPSDSIVIKTVWWPVSGNGLTPLPVWDADLDPTRQGGNGYLGWQRIVAVDPGHVDSESAPIVRSEFLAKSFANVRRVGLEQIYHVAVDSQLAERLMRDRETRKAILIALGREIRGGDYLMLVGANLATKELRDWSWAAIWWHDGSSRGPYAAGRPDKLSGAWRNYLMQVAFDSDRPVAPDGGPHICFDPWLEGRFPDGGHGGGTTSNCMACHRRASLPAISFLPVSRGAPDLLHDPAYAPGRLRTGFLWAIALHARP
jgi:hypothetical protein